MAGEVEQEYIALLDLLAKVVEANKGTPTGGADGRYYDAEGLATKLFFHTASALYLYRGTAIADFPSYPITFRDSSSIEVLARAALETFLAFHYVFTEPKAPEDKDFRCWAYRAAGLTERQDLSTTAPEHRQKLDEEKRVIDDLHGKLRSNSIFKKLDRDQQKRILQRGEWRLKGWSRIATDAGLGGMLAHVYRHMAGQAHSSALSILQLKQAHLSKEEDQLINPTMNIIKVVLAWFILEYCELFPLAENCLAANPEAKSLAEAWRKIGAGLNHADDS